MAAFDPDVFGAPAKAQTGFDADVFTAPTARSAPAPAPAPIAPAPAQPTRDKFDLHGEGYDRMVNYSPRDTIGGQLRGAGSIGATILAPIDALARMVNGGKPISIGGYDIAGQDRRGGMDAGLQAAGVDTNSTQFQTNKLGAEIAGTAGIGGAAANALGRIPGASAQIPALMNAIRTGGMTTGAPAGASRIADMATRVAGGAVNGGLTAGAINPADADAGMMIGGAFPLATKALGTAGNAVGGLFKGGPAANPTKLQTARESMEAGYVIPPNMVKPSFTNGVLESISGKQATQQFASTKNTEVTEKLTRQALGIADDVPLTQGTMDSLRKTAGKAYAEVSNLSPQASADLEALKVARNEAQGWFKAYNRSARPDDLVLAKQARALSDSLETALEGHATQAGRPELIPALRDARKAIAKTYTVGRALNDASGTVDARVLGRMYEKGLPLSDGLDTAGKFASAFPKAAISPQQVGSPGAHNLKAGMSGALGVGGFMGAGPLGAAAAALPFVAPPVARSIMFSNRAQQGLLNQGGGQGLLGNAIDEALPLMYRSSGLLGTR
jgi:hypothetical protein